MSTPAVPTNLLQGRLRSHLEEIHSPHTGTIHSIAGTIIEVYDAETVASIALDKTLSRKIEENPGLIYAKVSLDNGTSNIWSFKDRSDYFSLLYGNAAILIGQRCYIEFNGMNIYNGRIVVRRNDSEQSVNLSTSCRTLDIGSIV